MPIDLSHLREFTRGDVEEERLLFAAFLQSADETLQKLEDAIANGANEDWRQAAHMLKGAAGNLGATALFELCRDAEQHHTSDSTEKRRRLDALQAELTRIRDFIATLEVGKTP